MVECSWLEVKPQTNRAISFINDLNLSHYTYNTSIEARVKIEVIYSGDLTAVLLNHLAM